MVQGTHGVPLFESPQRPRCDPKDEAEDLQREVSHGRFGRRMGLEVFCRLWVKLGKCHNIKYLCDVGLPVFVATRLSSAGPEEIDCGYER